MDGIYRYQRHIYDLTRKYYLLGRDGLIRDLDPPQNGSVLEIGCGTGRNLIHAAKLHRDARLYGIDISAQMLVTGRTKVARQGFGERIRLAEADATDFDPQALFGEAAFDRIFISYSLSMIPEWRGVIGAALKRLAPGGRLSIVDFGQQENLPGWFRALLFAWLDRFHVHPRAELSRAIGEAARARGMGWRVGPLYRGYAWYGVVERPVGA